MVGRSSVAQDGRNGYKTPYCHRTEETGIKHHVVTRQETEETGIEHGVILGNGRYGQQALCYHRKRTKRAYNAVLSQETEVSGIKHRVLS